MQLRQRQQQQRWHEQRHLSAPEIVTGCCCCCQRRASSEPAPHWMHTAPTPSANADTLPHVHGLAQERVSASAARAGRVQHIHHHLQRLLRLHHDCGAAVCSAQAQREDDHAPAAAEAGRVARNSLRLVGGRRRWQAGRAGQRHVKGLAAADALPGTSWSCSRGCISSCRCACAVPAGAAALSAHLHDALHCQLAHARLVALAQHRHKWTQRLLLQARAVTACGHSSSRSDAGAMRRRRQQWQSGSSSQDCTPSCARVQHAPGK